MTDYSKKVDAALESLVGQGFLDPGGGDETELLIAALLEQAGYTAGQIDVALTVLEIEPLPNAGEVRTYGEGAGTASGRAPKS